MTAEHIISGLRSSGYRLTRARKAIISLLANARSPLSVPEMLERLLGSGLSVNRATIYREVEFLRGLGMVSEVHVGDGPMLYELSPDGDHHHHLICTGCSSVQCIEIERCLDPEFKAIERKSKFKVMEHSLQLYGLCQRCR